MDLEATEASNLRNTDAASDAGIDAHNYSRDAANDLGDACDENCVERDLSTLPGGPNGNGGTSSNACGPALPRSVSADPLPAGSSLPDLLAEDEYGQAFNVRSTCGAPTFVFGFDNTCGICQQFLRDRIATLAASWRAKAPNARVIVSFPWVWEGNNVRNATPADLQALRVQYNLPANIELINGGQNSFWWLVGMHPPRVGMLVNSQGRLVKVGIDVPEAEILAVR